MRIVVAFFIIISIIVISGCAFPQPYTERELLSEVSKSEYRDPYGVVSFGFSFVDYSVDGSNLNLQAVKELGRKEELYTWNEVEYRSRYVIPSFPASYLNPFEWLFMIFDPDIRTRMFGRKDPWQHYKQKENEQKTGDVRIAPNSQRVEPYRFGRIEIEMLVASQPVARSVGTTDYSGDLRVDLVGFLSTLDRMPSEVVFSAAPVPNEFSVKATLPVSAEYIETNDIVVPKWNSVALAEAIDARNTTQVNVLLRADNRHFDTAFQTPNDGDTLVLLALHKDMASIARQLVGRGFDVSSANMRSQTPLIVAASHGDLRTVTALIAQGVPLDSQDGDGSTALYRAVKNGHDATAALLLESGADYRIASALQPDSTVSLIRQGNLRQSRAALDRIEQQERTTKQSREVLDWLFQ